MKIKYLAVLLLAASCAPTIKNFDEYQKQFLSKTAFMPSKDSIAGKAPRIAIFALDENENEVATRSKLGKSIATNIENIISKARLGKIVDRRATKKLKKEIILSESRSTGSYKGPIVADYAISGSISNAGFTSKYSKGHVSMSKTGQLTSVPARYKYSSRVSGNLKIYELPSLAVAESIEFSAKESRTENARQDGGVSIGNWQFGGKKVAGAKKDDSLVRKSGKSAIQDIEVDIKNFLAKKGYILEKRVLDKKTIFKITLGSLDGIKHGDKFEVSGKYENENPLTNKIETERRIITTGAVSDKINSRTSWVVIDNSKKIDAIRLGDTVRLKYKRSNFSKASKLAWKLLDN